jgi:hypothetical protein
MKAYVAEIYCESPDCNGRQSTVIMKNNPEPKTWRCPACGARVKVHLKLPLAAYQKQQLATEARARRLANWK